LLLIYTQTQKSTAASTCLFDTMDKINYRQLSALAFVISLASTIRLIPKLPLAAGGSVACLSPLFALPLLLLYIVFLSRFFGHRREGEGLCSLILRCTGNTVGRGVLAVFSLSACLLCGFILCADADRYISTIYPTGSAVPFIAVMLALGLIAALGSERSLIRAAKLFTPILAAVFAVIFAFALTDIDPTHFMPITRQGIKDALRGSVYSADVLLGGLMFTAFFEQSCDKRSARARSQAFLPFLAASLLLHALLCISCTGHYGAYTSARLSYPFFVMLRDITLFKTVERIEAFIVALWVLPDFIVVSGLLTAASHISRFAIGFMPQCVEPFFSLRGGRWLIIVSALFALGAALFISTQPQLLEPLSEKLVPAVNLALSLLMLPLCFLIGKLRKKI